MSRPVRSHEPFAEWAALASIQALDGDELLRFEAHLAAGCAECEETQRECAMAAAALPLALPEVPVPPQLRDRVLARVEDGPRLAPPLTRTRPETVRSRLWPWAAGLVAAGIVGVTAWDHYQVRSTLEQQRAAVARLQHELASQRMLTSLVGGTDSSVAALKGTSPAPQADGWIAWSPARKSGFLVVHNLPMSPPGKQYQLWVISAGQPASAGVFDVDNLGHASLVVPVEAAKPDGFAITLEPAGGGSAPSGAPLMTSPSRS